AGWGGPFCAERPIGPRALRAVTPTSSRTGRGRLQQIRVDVVDGKRVGGRRVELEGQNVFAFAKADDGRRGRRFVLGPAVFGELSLVKGDDAVQVRGGEVLVDGFGIRQARPLVDQLGAGRPGKAIDYRA